MAKNSIRFRFVVNQRGAGSRVQSEARGAVNAVMQDLVARYAEGTYNDIKTQVAGRLRQDIMAELSVIAGQFKSAVIGISGSKRAPVGRMGMAHEMASISQGLGIRPVAQSGTGISWPARSKKYLNWKSANYHHAKWFLNKGNTLGSMMGKSGTWLQAFGPIQVKISHGTGGGGGTSLGNLGGGKQRVTTRKGSTRYRSPEDSNFKMAVANIQVSALTNITPRMLPALASGNLGSYAPDGRKTGLIGMLPDSVAYRLGGNAQHVPYRHTVEPFLSFVLTQSVPNALFLRVEKGLGNKLSRVERRRS